MGRVITIVLSGLTIFACLLTVVSVLMG